MTSVNERVAELRRILDAILAGAGTHWPEGLIDAALKRLEATIEFSLLTDAELSEIYDMYVPDPALHCGPITWPSLLIETARRQGLSGQDRLVEESERIEMRESET